MKIDDEHLRRLVNAWMDPGIAPAHHYAWKARLKQEWPILFDAIEKIIWNIEP